MDKEFKMMCLSMKMPIFVDEMQKNINFAPK